MKIAGLIIWSLTAWPFYNLLWKPLDNINTYTDVMVFVLLAVVASILWTILAMTLKRGSVWRTYTGCRLTLQDTADDFGKFLCRVGIAV